MIDDTLLQVPQGRFARTFALNMAKKLVRGIDLKTNKLTVGGAVRSISDAAAIQTLKDRVTAHPLFQGTVVDATGATTAVVVRLKKTERSDA